MPVFLLLFIYYDLGSVIERGQRGIFMPIFMGIELWQINIFLESINTFRETVKAKKMLFIILYS